jgi:methionine-rich copper-binding protein CopC
MRGLLTALVLPPLLFGAAEADAHAFLDHANPPVGGRVGSAPQQIALWFTQSIEPAFSSIEVRDAAGRQVDQGDVRVAADDPARLSVSLRPLSPGVYKVIWRVVSIDTHATDGDYAFRVGP